MPKQPIDYSETFVYMLCCKDPTITDVYVGHTTNLTKRKAGHKNACNNPNIKDYNYFVYQFIRENGGWNNWELIVLETKSCIDKNDARRFEREWFEKKGATLNKQLPITDREEQNELKIKYYYEHHEEMCEKAKIYNQEHKEERREYKKKYDQKNKDKKSEYNRIYNQERREENNRKERERYALKKLQKESEVNLSV
jgi:hypothetical protein